MYQASRTRYSSHSPKQSHVWLIPLDMPNFTTISNLNITCSLNAPIRFDVPPLRGRSAHRTIHTSSCYRRVTANVCSEPQIIRSTQPLRRSQADLPKRPNFRLHRPPPPKPKTMHKGHSRFLGGGGSLEIDPMPSRRTNHH